MKNIYKLIGLFLVVFAASCDQDTGDTDFLNNRTPYLYFGEPAGTLFAEEDQANIYQVQVSVSEPKSQAITYTVAVDPDSEAVEGVDFTLPSTTFTVEPGQIYGYIPVTANFDVASTAGKIATFEISSTADVEIPEEKTSFNLNIVKLCPIEAPFTGTYVITQVSGGIEAAGYAPVFGDAVTVTLTTGANVTERLFDVKFYPDFGFTNPPAEVSFSLVCDEVIVNGNNDASGVGCGGSIAIGAAETPSTYDTADDTSFYLTLTEDVDENCGPPAQTVVLFTKQ